MGRPSRLSALLRPMARRHWQAWHHARGRVVDGPFEGMRLTPDTTGALLPPYLVGSFEAPLHPTIAAWDTAPPDRLINIGSGDGYFAAGFAHRWPQCQVLAGDLSPSARENTLQWAKAAGVQDRVEVVEGFTIPQLTSRMHPSDELTCVWCDCEGGERVMADPKNIPAWKGVRFVIETHAWIYPGLDADLEQRFAETHTLEWIMDGPRFWDEWSLCAYWPEHERDAVLDEGREHPGRWLVGTPRT